MAFQANDTLIEEQELKKQAATRRRVVTLFSILFVAFLARVFISDPPEFVAPDHSEVAMQYLPGMLAVMPESAKTNLTAQQIAKFQEADANAMAVKDDVLSQEWVQTQYKPQEPLSEMNEDLEAYKEQLFQYAKKRKKIEDLREKRIQEERIKDNKLLVLFGQNRFVRVDQAVRQKRQFSLRLNKNIRVQLPAHMVRSVTDKPNWKPPVPKGYVRIKPAYGVTMVVSKQAAKRIQKRKLS